MLCAGGKKTISEGDLREAVEKVMLGEKSNRTPLGGKNWNGWHIMKWATR